MITKLFQTVLIGLTGICALAGCHMPQYYTDRVEWDPDDNLLRFKIDGSVVGRGEFIENYPRGGLHTVTLIKRGRIARARSFNPGGELDSTVAGGNGVISRFYLDGNVQTITKVENGIPRRVLIYGADGELRKTTDWSAAKEKE